MARRTRPTGATLYDFRDLDIMHRIAEVNGSGMTTADLADALGFDAEEGGSPVGSRLGWMRRYDFVTRDDRDLTWSLSRSGKRIVEAHLRAPQLRVVSELPDDAMVEVMAQVTSRFQRGDRVLAEMLRREFLYG